MLLTGQKILKDHSERLKEDMESGVVDESKPLGRFWCHEIRSCFVFVFNSSTGILCSRLGVVQNIELPLIHYNSFI